MKLIITDQRLMKTKAGNDIPVKVGVWVDKSRYTGEKLREVRKTHGVGRPPKLV